MRNPVVAARLLAPEKAAELYVLELVKGADIPRIGQRMHAEKQPLLVVGILDYGDGHGPVVLAVEDTAEAEEALS